MITFKFFFVLYGLTCFLFGLWVGKATTKWNHEESLEAKE